jgi:hypothetical protein
MMYFTSGRIGKLSMESENLGITTVMLSYSMICRFSDVRKRMVEIKNGNTKVTKHFLDSGSFSLWSEADKYAKEHKTDKWAFYDTDAHWQYLDAYAEFVKQHIDGIDYYANVDAIPNPELTWRNQKYLEEQGGINPVPVIHYGSDLKWLKRYIKEGYTHIALGGLVGSINESGCREWLDRCFDIICDTKDRKPQVDVHGFGVAKVEFFYRYPWFSVDSSSWLRLAAFGSIFVPYKRYGKFDMRRTAISLNVSKDSPKIGMRGQHVLTLSQSEKAIVQEWLDHIGVPLGDVDGEDGVICNRFDRLRANVHYTNEVLANLPEYPWAFRQQKRNSFGLV